MSDIGDNIRRIAQTEELKELIEQLIGQGDGVKDKSRIDGKRTIAYQNSDGSISSKASTPGTADTTDPGSTDPVVNNGDDAGNESGSGRPGEPKTPEKDNIDLQDLLDDGASVGDKIAGLLGLTDCGGGNVADIYMDGAFRPHDFEGLSDYGAETDPRQDNFLAGAYYIFTVSTAHNNPSAWGAVNAGLGELDANDPPNAPHSISSIAPFDPVVGVDGSSIAVVINRNAGELLTSVSFNKGNCTVGVDSYCPATAPNDKWPADGKHQLRFDGAQFLTSTYESDDDINGPWGQNNGTGGPSEINGCTSGGDTVTIKAEGNGTSSVTFENGDVYKLDNTGTVIEAPERD